MLALAAALQRVEASARVEGSDGAAAQALVGVLEPVAALVTVEVWAQVEGLSVSAVAKVTVVGSAEVLARVVAMVTAVGLAQVALGPESRPGLQETALAGRLASASG